MATLEESTRDVVYANRILDMENVVDAFGHVTCRHPDDPEKFIMSRSRAPGIIERSDIMEFRLGGEVIDQRDRVVYGERFIHGALMEARPDINAVVHHHSHAVIPFGVTGVPIRPILHMGAAIGPDVPVWDIRDNFGGTDMLVRNMDQGRDLAKAVGDGNVALMRGHGAVVGGRTVREAVMLSVYLQVNANLQAEAMKMGNPTYLSDEEIEKCTETFYSDLSADRVWEYFCARAQVEGL
ncbi:MAG: class II aldolase/adducin family protein [Proteobacteria bacterium]|nr:class II aldolase/adducin family protein [Pseudomonadota bacterium]